MPAPPDAEDQAKDAGQRDPCPDSDALWSVLKLHRVAPGGHRGRLEDVARRRVPRDPNDWPTVALALTLECGIWTADADFLGCGVATWTTETLQLHLDA